MKKLYILFVIIFLASCEIEHQHSDLCYAIIDEDISYIRGTFDDILYDYLPIYSYFDPVGHLDNLHIFADIISEDPCIDARVICYACIETHPLQSEVLLILDDGFHYCEKVIDIATPFDSEMYFVGIHN